MQPKILFKLDKILPKKKKKKKRFSLEFKYEKILYKVKVHLFS